MGLPDKPFRESACSKRLRPGADVRHDAWPGHRNHPKQLRHQQDQIDETIGSRMERNDRDRELRQVLLERQIPIDRHEDIELGLGQREELAVGDSGPTMALNRARCVAFDMRREACIDTLVEENPHAAS